MKRLLIAALAALVIFGRPIDALAQCVSPAAYTEVVLAAFPGAYVVVDTTKARPVSAFAAYFNEMPPASDVQVDRVVVIGHPTFSEYYRVGLFFGGCGIVEYPIPTPVADDMLKEPKRSKLPKT